MCTQFHCSSDLPREMVCFVVGLLLGCLLYTYWTAEHLRCMAGQSSGPVKPLLLWELCSFETIMGEHERREVTLTLAHLKLILLG